MLSTQGRVLLLTSSPVPGGGMQTYHITLLQAGSTEANGLEVQCVGLASANADLQRKNRGFMSRKEALKI